MGTYSSEEEVDYEGQDSLGRNTEQERVGHKEEDRWTVDCGLLLNDHQLDVFPVFRTTACSVGKEYREGFHPFNEELNEPLFD